LQHVKLISTLQRRLDRAGREAELRSGQRGEKVAQGFARPAREEGRPFGETHHPEFRAAARALLVAEQLALFHPQRRAAHRASVRRASTSHFPSFPRASRRMLKLTCRGRLDRLQDTRNRNGDPSRVRQDELSGRRLPSAYSGSTPLRRPFGDTAMGKAAEHCVHTHAWVYATHPTATMTPFSLAS